MEIIARGTLAAAKIIRAGAKISDETSKIARHWKHSALDHNYAGGISRSSRRKPFVWFPQNIKMPCKRQPGRNRCWRPNPGSIWVLLNCEIALSRA